MNRNAKLLAALGVSPDQRGSNGIDGQPAGTALPTGSRESPLYDRSDGE